MSQELRKRIDAAYYEWCRPHMSSLSPDHPADAFEAGYRAALERVEFDHLVMRSVLDARDGEALADAAHRVAAELDRLRAENERLEERCRGLEKALQESVWLADHHCDECDTAMEDEDAPTAYCIEWRDRWRAWDANRRALLAQTQDTSEGG